MNKTTQLKNMLVSNQLEFIMEAHNGLSAKIVENAGGKISVESTLNEGSTFRIFLKANSIQQMGDDLANSKKILNGK